ncbi:uncharacterized protein LOC114311151 [Camellia sinensis]|uniref:uncharacterized protein LOC114311151 n=1 Tax=Camellia sinensis TaxID=4442 RepID=UPI0010368556|nr:uncharacterized protein LOC114311151 [Camellia sinensis]
MERLDRALSNPEWRTMFPEATRPFRFEAAWISHPGFLDIINSSWTNMHNNLLDSTAEFTRRVTEWNKEVFGNIFKRKRHLLARIEGIQKTLANNFSHNLHVLEQELLKQYNVTLLQEETLWFQKSRAKRITFCDRNTKFFHISTITKRRKTKINALKDSAGTWHIETNEIKAVILDYFQNLFNYEDVIQLDHCNNLASTYLTYDDNTGILKPISHAEILRAFKAIGSFKAPRKDGLQAIFYKTYWNSIG